MTDQLTPVQADRQRRLDEAIEQLEHVTAELLGLASNRLINTPAGVAAFDRWRDTAARVLTEFGDREVQIDRDRAADSRGGWR